MLVGWGMIVARVGGFCWVGTGSGVGGGVGRRGGVVEGRLIFPFTFYATFWISFQIGLEWKFTGRLACFNVKLPTFSIGIFF